MSIFYKTETEIHGVGASLTDANGNQFIIVAPTAKELSMLVRRYGLDPQPGMDRNIVITERKA